jgi:hypothetical protein
LHKICRKIISSESANSRRKTIWMNFLNFYCLNYSIICSRETFPSYQTAKVHLIIVHCVDKEVTHYRKLLGDITKVILIWMKSLIFIVWIAPSFVDERNIPILSNIQSTFDNCSLCRHSYTLPVPLNYLCNPCFKYWWYDWSNFCYNFFNSELLAETIHYFVFNFCFFTKFFKQKTCWLRAIIQAWSCLSYYTIIHPQG